jgi:chromosome segregation and condensation protein ScpB
MPYAQRYLWDHSREFFFRNDTGVRDLESFRNNIQGMDPEGLRDVLYKAILETSQEIPYLLETVGVLALTQEPVTAAQMADLLDIKVACVLDVLESLRAIIHFPKDPHKSLIIPRHSSLCDFLLSKTRSGSFFADPTLHGRLVSRCIDLLLHSSPPLGHPAWLYAKKWSCIEPKIQPFEAILLSNAPDYIFDNLYASVFREASNKFMDKVYKLVLENSQEVPHSSEVVTTIALVREPVSVAQMADLLDIEVACVLDVLKSLRAIIHNPKDLHNSPITPRHSSLCKSLLSESRSGSFFAHPALHARLALRCMNLALCPTTVGGTPASIYAKQHVRDHIKEILARLLEEHGSKEMLIQVRHVLQACSLWPCASALVYHNWCVYYVVLDPSYTLGLPEPFAFVAIENPSTGRSLDLAQASEILEYYVNRVG